MPERSSFARGEKASASVRLRPTRSEVKKSRPRSGGDFMVRPSPNDEAGGDWAYITFQNGVPSVQDIKTNHVELNKRISADPRVDPRPASVYAPDLRAKPMGLGRRAVTQLHLSAESKTRDNLVKLTSKLNVDCEDKPEFLQTTVKRGILWQQRDKLFSQWRERYLCLTPDHLNCFRKTAFNGMGELIFKLKLSDIEEVALLDRKGYLVISIALSPRSEGKVFLRKTEGIRDWFNSLQGCIKKGRILHCGHSFFGTRQLTDSSGMENWLIAKRRDPYKQIEGKYETRQRIRPEITLDELDMLYKSEAAERESEAGFKRPLDDKRSGDTDERSSPSVIHRRPSNYKASKINRLSLMSEIGLPDFGDQDLGIDLEKGIFLKKSKRCDSSSNDSGNNSMCTNGSVGSSNSASSNSRNHEILATHLENDKPEDEYRDQKEKGVKKIPYFKKRGLQITHV